jgi:hypothetical protein
MRLFGFQHHRCDIMVEMNYENYEGHEEYEDYEEYRQLQK